MTCNSSCTGSTRMPRQFDLLIFDWDGTLMDSAGFIVDSIQKACADLGIAVPDDRACRQIIGLGLTQALQTLLPDLPPGEHPRLVERYRHYYLGQDAEIPLFEGVQEGIRELHEAGFTLAVATGKSLRGLDRALDHTRLRPYFSATRCADQTHSKPHPAMVEEIVAELMMDKAQTIVIGDTSHDMQMAQNAGVARLAVTYGAHLPEDLEPHAPMLLARSFNEVKTWLMNQA